MEKILEQLNPEQREAASHIDGPMLILAGAGSGKTKTITTRLAYLLSIGIDPANTLTLTFTNKAASEMRERALSMIDNPIYPPLLCTFHKFGLLFLKFNIEKLGRKNDFVVIDTDDKKRIIKNINKELPTSLVASEISRYKNSLVKPDEAIAQATQPNYKMIASIYRTYQDYLLENNLVDFDDLLMLTYDLLEQDSNLRKDISNRYQYIMVDEYQDTNELQLQLLKKLCDTHTNLCVVGDDDQSIYGWRGANIKNILEFSNMFDNAKVIKLESNYRSTKEILEAANLLIDHNRNRLGKRLVSTRGSGKPITLFQSSDENEESDKIARAIKELIDSGVSAGEIAVLYRINALSRSLEEGLNRAGIAYQMVGGVRFYERAEIKDAISYLRIIANSHDDFSFKRVINRPKRGIGKATIEKIEKAAYEKRLSIFQFLSETPKDELSKLLSKKAYASVIQLINDLETLQETLNRSTMDFIEILDNIIGLKEYYSSMPDGMERVLNLDEFYGLFRDTIKKNPQISLDEFLNEISLQSDQDQINGEQISIMSVHASKGLEFAHLFVIGMEEEFFPLLGDGCDIEEERRLGYVAMTRAKETLTLSTVQSRFHKGRRKHLEKSRFLTEAGLLKGSLVLEKSTNYKKGDLVKHKLFGMGRVLEVTRSGRNFKLKINFGGNHREILSSFVEKI
ncbi:3'-5' exonuclease [Hydrogenimonas thermophila]|uniref:ATP-dependent helicase n=1 Tax=Hydrogenimonas thermophila TaxID=223786 RepID=UPI002936E293|nr:UvrD-helicase domain-containing protein [Hydrogenimonas thermophila]WOE70306.1 3'-5' exonuclease [Hydrogenimonas thermophila]WOE72823.1 3'-5' exonuclease [Hydrogenimonas thermophila]